MCCGQREAQQSSSHVYTENEEQNDKLIKANNLIQALDLVSEYRKVYPLDICRGTSEFLNNIDSFLEVIPINLIFLFRETY